MGLCGAGEFAHGGNDLTDPLNFPDFWRERIGATPPVGYLLRSAFAERWIRFHALPEAKRYAQTRGERETIIRRAGAIAGQVLGSEAACWLVANEHVEPGAEASLTLSLDGGHVLDLAFGWREAGAQQEDGEWRCYARQCIWRPGAFDLLLARIADGREHGLLWVDRDSCNVFAPYDGGFDVIAGDPADALALADRFGDWRSARPDGL